MKPLLLFVLMLFAMHGRSQDDDLVVVLRCFPTEKSQAHAPFFRLTEKDLAHLPFVSIMEVLNARFPFVFADPPSTSMYTFLVDGHLVLNPNAINISQIESVEFYPVSLDAGSGSLSSRGTFVIATKRLRPGNERFNVRSQTGMMFLADKTFGSSTRKGIQNEVFTHQEVAYSFNKKKFEFNVAGSFTKTGLPTFQFTEATSLSNQSHDLFRQRLSLFAAYRASEKLRFSLAFLGTVQQQNSAGGTEYFFPQYKYESNAENDQSYGGATIGVEYNTRPVSNSLQVEYSHLKSTADAQYKIFYSPPSNNRQQDDDLTGKLSRLAVVNTTKGTIYTSGLTRFGWQMILRYHESKSKINLSSVMGPPSGPPTAFSTAMFKGSERTLAIMPSIGVDLKNQLFIQAGVVFDTWKNSAYLDPKKELVLPYGDIRWVAPLKDGAVSSLHLFSTFGKSMQFNHRNDALDLYNSPGVVAPILGPVITYGEPAPGYNWVTGVKAGFFKNWILFSVNYLRGNGFPGLTRPIPMGGSVLEYPEVKRNGVSVDLQATIGNTKAFSGKFRTMLFYDRIELKEGSARRYNANPFLNDEFSPQWRGCVSLDASTGNFFMQVQGLLRFRDVIYGNTQPGAEPKPESNNGLTFLVVGYSFPLNPSKPVKQLDISLQTKNLLMMKAYNADLYYGSRYIGVGMNQQL